MTPRLAYLDTCLLIPLYIEEQGSPVAERVVVEFSRNGRVPIFISEATRLEFASVVARHMRAGVIEKEQAQQVLTAFDQHCERNFSVLPVQASDFRMAREWLCLLSTPLKAFDSLHMAIAHTHDATLVTADKQLAGAAAMFDVEHYFVSFSQT